MLPLPRTLHPPWESQNVCGEQVVASSPRAPPLTWQAEASRDLEGYVQPVRSYQDERTTQITEVRTCTSEVSSGTFTGSPEATREPGVARLSGRADGARPRVEGLRDPARRGVSNSPKMSQCDVPLPDIVLS